MRKTFALSLILFSLAIISTSAQLAVGYNTDGNTLSLSTNPQQKLWGEFRVNTKAYNQAGWSYSDRGITQAYLLGRIYSSKNVSLYSGGGFGVNALSEDKDKWVSVNIPVGIKINPFASLPDLYILGEYDPMFIIADGMPVINCISLGFRYILNKGE